jgi:hypothetical protein
MSAVRIFVAALCLAALSAVALFAWTERIPDVEVRTTPWRTHTGTIVAGVPVGQGFVCESDGLRAVDVAVVAGANHDGEFELTLRERSTDSRGASRTARAPIASVPPGGGFLRFEFDPVPDSSGKSYSFALAPVSSTPRVMLAAYEIYRGQAQDVRAWGDHVASAKELEGTFVCEHPDLRALAIGMVAFDPSAGGASLELWYAGVDGPPIVRAEIAPRAPIENGWAFFPMPVVRESRWKTFRYRLTLPKSGQANAGSLGLSMTSYHGSGAVSPRLLGMTVRGESLPDRDLVFRAWSRGSCARAWALLCERGGMPVAIAWCLWIAASIAILWLMRSAAR